MEGLLKEKTKDELIKELKKAKKIIDELEAINECNRGVYTNTKYERIFFEYANDAVFVFKFNVDGEFSNFIDINIKACEQLGYSRDELLSLSIREISSQNFFHEEKSSLENLRVNGGILSNRTHVAKDGTKIPVEISTHVVKINGEYLCISIARDITERISLMEEMKKMASLDPLTGILNLREFMNKGNNKFELAKKNSYNFSLLMLDIDNFKEVNDNYGHRVGDRILKGFVSIINRVLRSNDIFGRVGGDEFAIIFLNISEEESFKIAERIRQEIQRSNNSIDGKNIKISVSIGMSAMSKNDTFEKLFVQSDDALYKSKTAGRNVVTVE